MRIKNLKKKLGQNTAEYLIMLVLVAVGSIGIFTVFGDTVRKQLSNVVNAFSGKDDKYDLTAHGTEAKARAGKGISMNGIEGSEVTKYGADAAGAAGGGGGAAPGGAGGDTP